MNKLELALDQDIDCPCGSECIKCSPRVLLAEQAEQEPVAWKDLTYGNLHHQDFGNSIPLYAGEQQ